jgi:hypothetical protein
VLGTVRNGDCDGGETAQRITRMTARHAAGHARLADQAFYANAFFAGIADAEAMLLVRSKSTRNPPVIKHLPDAPTCLISTAWACGSSKLT